MGFMNQTENKIQQGINTICKTAIVVRDTMEEDGHDLIDALDDVVESIIISYSLDDEMLVGYRAVVEGGREYAGNKEPIVTPTEAAMAQNMIFEFCDTLTDPKEIMDHVRAACEMVKVWNV